ncbi:MAG TPA: peptidase S10 [Phycisphaerae bacterium]|nr:peptidase S10 [Phycisphaerae bacterium]
MVLRRLSMFLSFSVFCVILLITTSAMNAMDLGSGSSAPSGTTQPSTAGLPQAQPDKISTVHRSITIDGKPLNYTVTTGYMPMKDSQDKLEANVFFIAYTLDDPAQNKSERPITFVFNGGPGAASVWLHLGCAGPVCVELTPDGNVTPPPYKLVDNADTWLTATDLVFIDPVGTGYSRPAAGAPDSKFYGVQQDVESVGNFIRLYTTLYQRWGSPKFLAGESYGTTRACALADYLSQQVGMNLNGIILISCALNFQTLSPDPGNDTPYPLYLPTYTATAWYHHKLPADLEKNLSSTLSEVENWAIQDYTPALSMGDSLSPAQRDQIADQLVRYTGLSKQFILLSNLRISPFAFEQELLRDQQLVVGRMDTRITGFNQNPTHGSAEYDPAVDNFVPVFTSAFNQYVRSELNYSNDLPYEALAPLPWDMGSSDGGYLYVTDNLQNAMVRNPYLKVMVCSGYFDLATPFFATIYTFNHLDLPDNLRKNIQEIFFDGGHMLYHPESMRAKLAENVRAFISGAISQSPGGETGSVPEATSP